MGEERKMSEIRVESEGTVEEVVAEHISTKKEKKKKKKKKKKVNSEADDDVGKKSKKRNKEKRADSDGVKKSEKKRVDSEAEDDGVKKSKKKNKEKKAASEAEDDGVKKSKKKNEEKSVDSEAEDDSVKKKSKKKRVDSEADDDGVKKSKKKNKEKKADSEAEDDGVKKSKKKNEAKSVDSEAEDDCVKKSKKKMKKSKKESGGDEIGNSEENQSDGKSLVNTDDAKRETGKRKRDDSDLGAEENTENSDEEIKRISKKKKPSVDSEVEESSLSSAKDAKKISKEKKPCEDPEVEENNGSTKDAKKKPSENSEAEENEKKKQSELMSVDSEAEENKNDGTKDAKNKLSEDPEVEENNLVTTMAVSLTAGVLTPGVIERIISGEVRSENDIIPVLQVIRMQNFRSRGGMVDVLTLSDGTASLQSLFAPDLPLPGEVVLGCFVRVNRFNIGYIQNKWIIFTNRLEFVPKDEQQVSYPETQEQHKTSSANWIGVTQDSSYSSQDSVVFGTQELQTLEVSKSSVLDQMKLFRKGLGEAEVYIHDTRNIRDQIRATIRCFILLKDRFHCVLQKFGGGFKEDTGLIEVDDREELSKDKLRSNADTLLKLFKNGALKRFVNAFSHLAYNGSVVHQEALTAIEGVVRENVHLLHAVMHKGFDCRRELRDEEEIDDYPM